MIEIKEDKNLITQKEEIEIPVDSIFEDFGKHLNIPKAKRFLFSGKFGIGKTYFLKKFFENHKDTYETFHLYPVNYQISNNEDILELIKYDILIELLNKNKDTFKENKVEGLVDNSLLFYSWFKEKLTMNSLLQSTISTSETVLNFSPDPISNSLGKLGRSLSDLLEVDKEFQKFKEEYRKGEKGLVDKYAKKIKEKNISETDYFSHLIKEKIGLQKKEKKSVLVLDDLDRLDPEHMFRLLNIFSAFFERSNNNNKFGFDKIILVADYNNLKSIFHHKYGENTESEGYFDKFFSVDIYNFNIKEIIKKHIDNDIIGKIQNENKELEKALRSNGSGYVGIFIKGILLKMVDYKMINMRELLKPVKFQINALSKGMYIKEHFVDSRTQFIDISIKILLTIFAGRKDELLKKLKVIKERIIKSPEDKSLHYNAFIPNLLRDVSGKDITKTENINYVGGKYHLKRNSESPDEFDLLEGRPDELFYELLIKYIDGNKYVKSGIYEYGKSNI